MYPVALVYIVILGCVAVAYFAGYAQGTVKSRRELTHAVKKALICERALDDVDRWCAHISPHAKAIMVYLHGRSKREMPSSLTLSEDEIEIIVDLNKELILLNMEIRRKSKK